MSIAMPSLPHLAALALALTLAAPAVQAQVAVIVHPSNKAVIDDESIAKLFLGQVKTFPGGAPATPIEQKNGSLAEEFHVQVLNKPEKEVRKIWARNVFTGGLKPPTHLDDDEAVLQFVANTPDAIGYVQASKVNNKVKVLRKAP